jgi:hypothetical protein
LIESEARRSAEGKLEAERQHWGMTFQKQRLSSACFSVSELRRYYQTQSMRSKSNRKPPK